MNELNSAETSSIDNDLRVLIRLLAALENAVWNDMVDPNGVRIIRRALEMKPLSPEWVVIARTSDSGELDETNSDLREELNRLNQRLRRHTGEDAISDGR